MKRLVIIGLITFLSGCTEVFRDSYPYSTRHDIGITWLSGSDQLWLLPSDVGTAHVDRQPDGTWIKTGIRPETISQIPAEIAALGGCEGH